jgi:hypothetical protein
MEWHNVYTRVVSSMEISQMVSKLKGDTVEAVCARTHAHIKHGKLIHPVPFINSR